MYGDVFDRLERDEVRYVVIGGVAVCLHGHVRPVADLDIVIDPAPHEADRALRTLALSGFVPSIPLPLSMLSVLRMFDPSHREVDVNVRYHIAFNDLWASSRRVRVGDSVARVTSLEHLLRVKRITARPHDLLDIEGLLQGARPLATALTPLYGGQDLPMLDKLTIESFEPHVGTSFWLHAEHRKIELRLTRAAKVMESEAARLTRTPFSLFFLAPVLLPQQIYRLTHEGFAEPLDIFLVPIRQDASGFTHEAVFT